MTLPRACWTSPTALGLERLAAVGHDWGARVAYTLAALVPERITAIAVLALAYQSRGAFSMPGSDQARASRYQWLMFLDAGVDPAAATRSPFARIQRDTWSPPGWFDEASSPPRRPPSSVRIGWRSR